jgi:hypothetical protein
MLIKEALSILTATNQRIQEIGFEIVSPELQGSPKQPRLQTQLNALAMRYTMLLQHIILNDDGDEILGTIGENDADINAILIDLQKLADLNDIPGLPIPRVVYTTNDDGNLPAGNALGDLLYFDGTEWLPFARGASGEVLVSTPTTIQWQSVIGNGIPSGGSTGQFLKKNTNTSYDVVWDDITLPDLGVTASAAELNIMDGVIVSTAEINFLDGVNSLLVDQLAAKLSTSLSASNIYIGSPGGLATQVNTASVGDIQGDTTNGLFIKSGVIVNADISPSAAIMRNKIATGSSNRVVINDNTGAMSLASAITADRVLVSNSSGIPIHSVVTTTTLGYLDATSSVQTQLNDRLSFSSAIIPAQGDVIYFNGATWVNLGIGTNGQLLSSDGTVPVWVSDPPAGLPVGGSTDQILRKIDGTDYNTEWHTLVAADLSDVTATYSELNVLSGVTVTSTKINFLADVTGLIQAQIDNKVNNSLAYNAIFVGTAANQMGQLNPGSNGQVLTIIGAAPVWTTPATPGDVSGPGLGNSTDNAVVRWNTTSGTAIQNSTVILGDDGIYTFPSAGGIQTGTSAGNTVLVKAYDVDGVTYTTFITITANNTPTMDLNSTTTVGSDVIYRHLSGYPLAQPTVTEDGYTILWDNGTLTWIYAASGGGGHVIQEDGTPVPQEDNLNFVTNFTITDDPGNLATKVALKPNLTLIDTITLNNGGRIRTGITAADTVLFQAYDNNTGPAYVTFATLTAGNTPTFDLSDSVTKSGAYIYRAGGTDVALADGGTGASLADPNADRILFWDDSAGAITWLTVGTGLAITTTTIAIDDEGVQDAVGSILMDSANISLTYNDGTPSIIADIIDVELLAIAGLVSAANKIPYFTGSGSASMLDRDTDGTLAANSDTSIATQKAVKTYVDTRIAANANFGATFDGQGSVVLVNTKVYFRIPRSGTITAWSIVAEGTNPTCTIDIWKVATGTTLPVVGNSIMGTKPALATGNAIKSTNLTGWGTSFTADDIFCINIDACSAATKISFLIYV